MKVRFWGVRGSIPTPMQEAELQDKIKMALLGAVGVDLTDRTAVDRYVERLAPTICSLVGGNTPCIEVRAEPSSDAVYILDCGSGMRPLGVELMKEGFGRGRGTAHIFISHTHWDHIQGFPFFSPAYVPGNSFHFHSPYEDLRERFEGQQIDTYFPVAVDYMRGARTWNVLTPTVPVMLDGVEVTAADLSHPGHSYAYRLSCDGKSVVYATDGEYHRMDTESTAHFVEFFRDADVLIFDAQFSFEQVIDEKRDWGHSTPKMGAELAFRAGVKRLVLFHHDPAATDERLWSAVDEAYHHLVFRNKGAKQSADKLTQVILAREGLTIEI